MLQIAALFFFVLAILALWQQSRTMRRNIDDVYRINDQANQKLQAMIALLSDLKKEFDTKNHEISDLHRIPTDLADLSRRMKNVESEFTRMADTFQQQEQISKAIAMAQRGSKRAEIVEGTGLSAEQADTIVRFHGPDSE
ncbi:MAG: hypothetical protein CML73_03980 [Rhodobiaceae bacterium]|nr:hypothetical protein [Rhodobiaceae bacterium]